MSYVTSISHDINTITFLGHGSCLHDYLTKRSSLIDSVAGADLYVTNNVKQLCYIECFVDAFVSEQVNRSKDTSNLPPPSIKKVCYDPVMKPSDLSALNAIGYSLLHPDCRAGDFTSFPPFSAPRNSRGVDVIYMPHCPSSLYTLVKSTSPTGTVIISNEIEGDDCIEGEKRLFGVEYVGVAWEAMIGTSVKVKK